MFVLSIPENAHFRAEVFFEHLDFLTQSGAQEANKYDKDFAAHTWLRK
jgi:hypothetical protein